jgi:predicted transcriptional regulator
MKSKLQFENKQLENIFVQLAYMVNSGEIDIEEIEHDVEVYVKHYTGIHLSISPEHTKNIKQNLKEMRDTMSHLLKSIISSLNKQIEYFDDLKSTLSHIQDFTSKYPFYVKPKHPKEAIKFYDNNLKDEKEELTYTKSGELLGLSRQSISKYVENETHGFRNTGKKKLTKMEVYNFFVEYLCKK